MKSEIIYIQYLCIIISQIPKPEPKKPRIQEDLDIPRFVKQKQNKKNSKNLKKKKNIFFFNFSLAASGLLHKKANVATLRTWLGSQGIAVKSKSKKEDLVNLVLSKLGTMFIKLETAATNYIF